MTDKIQDKQQPNCMLSKRRTGMSPILPMLLFIALLTSSLAAAVDGVMRAEQQAQQLVDQALAETMSQYESFRIDADTIRDYRSHIKLAALRDTAFIAVAASADDRQGNLALEARTGLTLVHLWQLSDQKASGILAALAAMWAMASLLLARHRQSTQPLVAASPGGVQWLRYDAMNCRFCYKETELALTPMQHDLVQLFIQAPDPRLPQHVICERLWPKKPDASATLYTLVRRLKQTLAESTDLYVECDRGQAYRLTSAGSQVTCP